MMSSNIQVELVNKKEAANGEDSSIGAKRRNSGLEAGFVERSHELNNVVRRRVSFQCFVLVFVFMLIYL